MNEKLKEKIKESLSSVLPITVIVLVLSVTLMPLEIGALTLFLMGALLLIVGMGFFQLGAEMAMTPLGQGVGARLSRGRLLLPVVLICFVLGALVTIAEPDLQVLANHVASIPNAVLSWTVAVGSELVWPEPWRLSRSSLFVMSLFLRLMFPFRHRS